MDDPSFELIEDYVFQGRFSWRLKGNHIRISCPGDAPSPKPVNARNEQLARFVAVLDFLRVWEWKPNYDPLDLGIHVRDGMTWSFSALIGGRECKTSGSNAYPSFADPTVASLENERYAFLVLSMHSIFGIESLSLASP